MDEEADLGSAAQDELVDDAGRRWTTRWVAWCDEKQVRQLLHRDQDVLVRSPLGDEVTRLNATQARDWWRDAQHRFEVPGRTAAPSSTGGPTWAAHVWCCEDGGTPARLLVFETFC